MDQPTDMMILGHNPGKKSVVEWPPASRIAAKARAGKLHAAFGAEDSMDWKQVITADSQILHGAVRFVGTRIPVTVVLDNLAGGVAPAEILFQYPGLRPEFIPAALAYAAELARERVVEIPD